MELATVTSASPLTVRRAGDTVDVPATPMDVTVATDDSVLTENIDNTVYLLAGSRSAIPPGVFVPYGGPTAPAGWLLCNGAAVSRTTYADLFAAIGTTWGAGDGSTTFNLPDVRKRVPIGAGTGLALGATDGVAEASRTLQHTHPVTSQVAHGHNITSSGGHNHGAVNLSTGQPQQGPVGAQSGGVNVSGGSHTHNVNGTTGDAGDHAHGGSTGSAGSHNHGGATEQNTTNSTPHAVVNYIIKT